MPSDQSPYDTVPPVILLETVVPLSLVIEVGVTEFILAPFIVMSNPCVGPLLPASPAKQTVNVTS